MVHVHWILGAVIFILIAQANPAVGQDNTHSEPAPVEVPLMADGELREFSIPKPIEFGVAGFTGLGSFRLPLEMPQSSQTGPALHLSYKTQRKFGNCGYGCEISIPSIRVDPLFSTIPNASGWAFVQDSAQTRLIKAAPGAYYLETSDAPFRFRQTLPNQIVADDGHGNALVFGGTTETQILSPSGKIQELLLQSETNRFGVQIKYSWSNGALERIAWGSDKFAYQAQLVRITLPYSWPSYSSGGRNDSVVGSIRVSAPTGEVRRLELNYQIDSQQTWPRLASVVERSIVEPTKARTLLTTQFNAETVQNFQEVQDEQLTAGNAQEGRLRVVRSSSGGQAVPLLITEDGRILSLARNASAQFSWKDHGKFGDGTLSRYRVFDIDGDGREEVIFINGGQEILARSLVFDGTASLEPEKKYGHIPFVPYREDIDASHYRNVVFQEARYSFADFDGDGVPEAIFTDHHGTVTVAKLRVGSSDLSFGNPIAVGEGEQLSRYVIADFNGDGIGDLVLSTRDGRVLVAYAAGGVLAAPIQVASGVPSADPFRVLVGDLNADGLIDLVFTNTNQAVVLRNRGAVQAPELISIPAAGLERSNANAITVEANGDRITDLVAITDTSTKLFIATTQGYESRDVSFQATAEFLGFTPRQRMVRWFMADLNGDERPDLVTIDVGNKLRILLADKSQHTILSDGFLESIKNEYGGATEIRYASSSEFAHSNMPASLPVVRTVLSKADGSADSQVSYEYEGGLVSGPGREFRGFATVKAISSPVGGGAELEVVTTYLQGDTPGGAPDVKAASARYAGLPKSIVSTGKSEYRTIEGFTYAPMVAGGPFLRRPSTHILSQCDVVNPLNCSVSKNQSEFDSFGNTVKEFRFADETLVSVTQRAFRQDTIRWIVDVLDAETITQGNSLTILSKTEFGYSPTDSVCTAAAAVTAAPPLNAPTEVRRTISNSEQIILNQAYDQYGNVTCKRVGSYWETLTTDLSGTIVLRTTNKLGHTHEYKYYGMHQGGSSAFLGKMFEQTDPNKIRIQFGYDEYGRVSRHSLPNCPLARAQCLAKQLTYSQWGTPGSQKATLQFSNGIFLEAYFDGWARPLRVRRTGTRDRAIVQVRSYDYRGRLEAASLPFFDNDSPAGQFALTYDAFGNVTSILSADGTTQRACYRAKTKTLVDRFGRQTRETHDGLGRVIQRDTISVSNDQCAKDNAVAKATYKFEWDGLARLTRYQGPGGYFGTRQYDFIGNLRESSDPETGKTQFRYGGDRALLLKKIDARGGQVDYEYDEAGRIAKETLTLGSAHPATYIYRYDASNRMAVGKLYQIEGPDSLETVTFGKDEQPNRQQFRSGTFEYVADYLRDPFGRLLGINYSDGKRVAYNYNGRFIEQQTSAVGSEFLTINLGDYTPLGQHSSVDYSSGTAERRLYSSHNSDCGAPYRLCGVIIRNRQSQVLLTQQASFLADGNIASVNHGGDGVQQFTYDNFGKLLTSSWSKFPAVSLNYSYDQLDRLVDSASAGKYNYGVGMAPTRIGVEEVKYDASGYIAETPRYKLSFDVLGRLQSVTTSKTQKTFAYNANGRKVLQRNGRGETVFFPFDDVACSVGKCELEISVGENSRVIRRGNESLQFHKDLLGNPSLIVNSSGAVVDKVYFSPFGEILSHNLNPFPLVRNGFGFQFKKPILEASEQSNQAGAGHVQLLDFGARAYDTMFAIFVAPDVSVAEKADTIFMNRYAYGLHNPNFYSDSSGAMSEAQRDRWVSFGYDMAFFGVSAGFIGAGALNVSGLREPVMAVATISAIEATVDLKAALSGNPVDMQIADAVKAVADPTTAASVGFALVAGYSATGSFERAVEIAKGVKSMADVREFLKNPNAVRELMKSTDLTVKEATHFVKVAKELVEAKDKGKDIEGFFTELIKQVSEHARMERNEIRNGPSEFERRGGGGGGDKGERTPTPRDLERYEKYRRTAERGDLTAIKVARRYHSSARWTKQTNEPPNVASWSASNTPHTQFLGAPASLGH